MIPETEMSEETTPSEGDSLETWLEANSCSNLTTRRLPNFDIKPQVVVPRNILVKKAVALGLVGKDATILIDSCVRYYKVKSIERVFLDQESLKKMISIETKLKKGQGSVKMRTFYSLEDARNIYHRLIEHINTPAEERIREKRPYKRKPI